MELRAGVWTEWVLLLVLERHFRQDVQRPVISVPDMKLNHLLEVKGDVRETPTSAQTQTVIVKTRIMRSREVRTRSGLSQLLSVCLS